MIGAALAGRWKTTDPADRLRMTEIPNVCLNLSNSPENVLVVHQALSGVAETLGLDALESNDLDTAVIEACNNVVRHAYEGVEGPLEVEVYALPGTVDVVVRDHGIGIRPHVGERTQPHTGIGLPIVHALTQRVAYSNLAGGGTEMRMQFTMPNALALEPLHEDGLGPRIAGETEPADTIEMALGPSAVTRAVLPRVLSTLAERVGFSSQRISEVQLVADALAANARDLTSAGHLGVAANLAPGTLQLRIGPSRVGSAGRLLDAGAGGPGGVIERLSDDHLLASADSAETLVLRFRDRP
jgi:anti-sigma regulatory factor (Ser/Thr protein kinase)